MKASVLVFGCLVLAAPAQAFTHGAMHGRHPGVSFHRLTLGILSQGVLPDVIAPAPEAPAPQFVFEPAPRCPLPVTAPARPTGPHIIYIGHQPEISGPKVIYGTN